MQLGGGEFALNVAAQVGDNRVLGTAAVGGGVVRDTILVIVDLNHLVEVVALLLIHLLKYDH